MPHHRAPRHLFSRLAPLAALLPTAAHASGMLDRLKNLATSAGYIVPPGADTPGAGLRWAARIIGLFVGTLLALVGVVFIILIIAAGQRWMLARGNEQEVEKAKASIQSAIIGLLVVSLSYVIVTLVSTIITGAGLIKG